MTLRAWIVVALAAALCCCGTGVEVGAEPGEDEIDRFASGEQANIRIECLCGAAEAAGVSVELCTNNEYDLSIRRWVACMRRRAPSTEASSFELLGCLADARLWRASCMEEIACDARAMLSCSARAEDLIALCGVTDEFLSGDFFGCQ